MSEAKNWRKIAEAALLREIEKDAEIARLKIAQGAIPVVSIASPEGRQRLGAAIVEGRLPFLIGDEPQSH